MKHYILFMLALCMLSACKTTVKSDTPDVKIKGNGYEIEVEDGHGDFCPPGQAKKGNC